MLWPEALTAALWTLSAVWFTFLQEAAKSIEFFKRKWKLNFRKGPQYHSEWSSDTKWYWLEQRGKGGRQGILMAPGFMILFSSIGLSQGKWLPCCIKATGFIGSVLWYSGPWDYNSECYIAYLAAVIEVKFKGILRYKQMKFFFLCKNR